MVRVDVALDVLRVEVRVDVSADEVSSPPLLLPEHDELVEPCSRNRSVLCVIYSDSVLETYWCTALADNAGAGIAFFAMVL